MVPGTHYIEAETFEDLISKSIELMQDSKLQSELVHNARELFRNRYSIEYAANIINKIILQ